MALRDPLSLREVRQMSGAADTILLTATRNADLETPIGAFMRFDDGGPAFLLESVEGGERLGRYSFIGVGPRRLLTVRDNKATIQTRPVGVTEFSPDLPTETFDVPDPLAALRHFMPKRRILPTGDIPRFPGGAVGALAYDAASTFEPTVPLPTRDPTGVPMAAFQETDLVLVFDHLTHTLSAVAALHTEVPDIEGRYAIAERAIFEALERTGRPTEIELASLTRRSRAESSEASEATTRPVGVDPIEVSMTRDRYESEVRKAKEAIAAGEAIQIVVARRQTFEHPVVDGAPGQPGVKLDEVSIYRALRRVNPSPYLFFVRMPEFSVVGASPELLVRVEGDRMTTHPIAGTRPRGATPAEDDALADALQRDPKERAEHVMLMDLGRNDIGRVARIGSVRVTDNMTIERYSHVMHIVSNVEAVLASGLDAIAVLRASFPAGTVSGAPKLRAMEIIDELEPTKRGIYAGAVGYLGFNGDMDLAIAIRTAVIKDGRLYVQAGAGIVADSDPQSEWTETQNKARAILRAAEMAQSGLARSA